jgi:hypothetical protein
VRHATSPDTNTQTEGRALKNKKAKARKKNPPLPSHAPTTKPQWQTDHTRNRRKLEAVRQRRLEASDLADAHVGIAEAEVARLAAGVEALREREAGVERVVAATQRELARAEAARAMVGSVEAGIARCEEARRAALATRGRLQGRLAAAREEVGQGMAFVGEDAALAEAEVQRAAFLRADAFRLQQLCTPGTRLHRLARSLLFAPHPGSLRYALRRRQALRGALPAHERRVTRVKAIWGLWRWRRASVQARASHLLALRRERSTQAAVLGAWRRQLYLARRIRRWHAGRLRHRAKAALRRWRDGTVSAARAWQGRGAWEGRQLLRRCFGAWRTHLGRVRYLDPVAAAGAAGKADACRRWLAWRRLGRRVAAARRAREEAGWRLRRRREQVLVARCVGAWRGLARRARMERRLLHADDAEEGEPDEGEREEQRAWSSRFPSSLRPRQAPEAPAALRALEALLRRRMAAKALRALQHWRCCTRWAGRRQAALRAAVARTHTRRLAAGVALWRAGVAHQVRVEAVLAKRARQRARRLGRRVLWAWALVARRQRQVEDKEARLAAWTRGYRTRRLLTAWRGVLLRRRGEEAAEAKAERRLRWHEDGKGRRAARGAFGRWQAWVARQRQLRALGAWAVEAWAKRRLRGGIQALEAAPLQRRLGALRAVRGEKEKLARDCAAAEQQLRGLHRALARVERDVEAAAVRAGAAAGAAGEGVVMAPAMAKLEKVAFLRGKVEAMEAELARRKAHLAALRDKRRQEAAAAAEALSPQRPQRRRGVAGAIAAKRKAAAGAVSVAVSSSLSPSSSPGRVKARGKGKQEQEAAAAAATTARKGPAASEAALEAEERRLARALLELGRRAQQKEKQQQQRQQRQQQQQEEALAAIAQRKSSKAEPPPPSTTVAAERRASSSKGKRELGRVEARLQACLDTLQELPNKAAAERARGHEEVARLDRELQRLRGAVDAEAHRFSPRRPSSSRKAVGAVTGAWPMRIPEAAEEVEAEMEENGASLWLPTLGKDEDHRQAAVAGSCQQDSLLEEEDLEEVWALAGEVERVSRRLQQTRPPPLVQQQQP